MEVNAKLEVFGKKYEKQFADVKGVQGENYGKLLAEVKSLQDGLEGERAETLRDVSQADENLGEQLKFTSEYLKDTVKGWNEQN